MVERIPKTMRSILSGIATVRYGNVADVPSLFGEFQNRGLTKGWREYPVSALLLSHGQKHTAKVWNQPHQPYEEAVSVESFFRFFTPCPGHTCRPRCMDEHKPESNLPGESVRLPEVKRPFGHSVHGPSSGRIEQKTGPKCGHMPWFQIPGDSFGPYSDRVKDQCECD